jgi:hypothetical protein
MEDKTKWCAECRLDGYICTMETASGCRGPKGVAGENPSSQTKDTSD